MRFDIISANVNILNSSLTHGLVSRTIAKGLIEIKVHDLRNFTNDKHRQIDDLPYGGGSGMVLKPEPFFRCIELLKSERIYDDIIHLSPQGELFNQKTANSLSLGVNYILLCGHYKGIDQRVIDTFVTKEISIGEFVLSCGDIAALVVIDAIARLIPGALGDSESAITDSFQEDNKFDHPQYTRPETYNGLSVPEVLLSGNHKLIEEWRTSQGTEKFKKINSITDNKEK
ncbi:MAG: tRNA (guanosine(37)-N1)-methyltransferase TrmD [Ignavibacteriales bacterium UTCHB1]|nr:MAG: tRNA (guanosine(37)-N1)-methyltransferase TrmD [Ignavibacteriales bacterium UTCHB1]